MERVELERKMYIYKRKQLHIINLLAPFATDA